MSPSGDPSQLRLLVLSRQRAFASVGAAVLILLAGVLFAAAFLSSRTNAIGAADSPAGVTAVNAFAFSAPLQMPKPVPNPAVFFLQDAEPEIKIDLFGNIYVTAINGVPGGTDLWKSVDNGASFKYLGQPDGLQDKCLNPTPECVGAGGADDATDVSSGGYLYVTGLYIGNITVATSMDGGTGGTQPGQAWQVNPVGSQVPADDRQWIAAYGPQTLYLTMRQAPGTGRLFFFKSTDAGKTFVPSTANPLTTIVSREANLVVDKYNGNIYTAFTTNGSPNQITLLRSTDGGTTWSTAPIYTGPAGTSLENAFTILATDLGGNLHLAFSRCTQPVAPSTQRTNCHAYLMSTANPAAANPVWTAPAQIDTPAQGNTAMMPWIVGGSPGVVDITWYGSTVASPDATPSATDKSQWWNVYFAQTTNALAATPTFNSAVAASAVHNLPICSSGTGCVTSPTALSTRKLLEYFTMTLDSAGLAHIAYADSVNNCDPTSATAPCLTHTWYTKQTTGQSAYAPPAPPAPATFAANVPMPATSGPSPGAGAEPGIKVDSHNCIYTTAPGNPYVWKSSDNGLTFSKPVNPVADEPTLTGGDEEILPFPPNPSGKDPVYFGDLGLSSVHVRKSTDGGATWFKPGTGGAAGDVAISSDRQWFAGDLAPAATDFTIYEMDHELASEDIRFHALTNDTAWSPSASGITSSELILPPDSTFPNTNPGPVVVDAATHQVFGFFNASTLRNNAVQPPFGKMPNLWEAIGAGVTTAGVPPGPFTNVSVFRGVFD